MISLIYDIEKENCSVTVRAVVEDMILTHHQTNIDPPEYGPALCEASFEIEEDEIVPENEDELIDYLESLNLDWTVIYDDEE